MNTTPRSARGGLLLGAGLGAAVTIALLVAAALSPRSTSRTVSFRPDATVPRWSGEPAELEGLGLVADFDVHGNTLYVLDGTSFEVAVFRREEGRWRGAHRFGRAGAGPGELLAPHGLAVTRDGARVLIADDSRVHVFSAAGDYEQSTAIGTQCRLLRPRIAAARTGFFLTGNCYRVGAATDTMLSILYWTPDGRRFEEIAADVRFTRDGRVGSFMSALSVMSESDSVLLFGTGSTECVHEVTGPTGTLPPRARRLCGVVERRYSAPAPPALAARLDAERARRGGEVLMAWPDPLPAYMDRIYHGGRQFLLRPFTADSLVVEEVGDGRARLVLPLDGLVACRRAGCLWTEATLTGVRIRMLERASLDEALSGR